MLSSSSQIEIWASYLQIYCEIITDLLSPPDPLNPSASSDRLAIREKTDASGVYVEGLSKQRISSLDDLWELLLKGDTNRFTAATNANEQSSRSHAILMLSVLIPEGSDSSLSTDMTSVTTSAKVYKEGKLLLVDLAGSERAKASEGRDYMRLEEAKAINLSLSSLGNCMNALAEGRSYIPYRDSKLTRLLTNCLGGTSRTSLIVNLLPDQDITGETLNALRFASRASKVKVSAKVSKYQNYEQLYKELLAKTNNTNNGSNGGEASLKGIGDKSKDYDILLQEKQKKIDDQDTQISFLQQQLNSLMQENQLLRSSNSFNPPHSTNSSSTNTTPSDHTTLQEKIDELTKDHLQAMDRQYQLYQRKLQEKEQQIHRLTKDQADLQQSLYNEKELHYQTIQETRKLHEQLRSSETIFQQRLDDCLTTINQYKNDLDNQQSFIQSLQNDKTDLQRQIYHHEESMKNMVNLDQVKEMEMLFMETITRLSERVQILETSKNVTPKGSQAMKNVGGGGGGIGIGGISGQQMQQRGVAKFQGGAGSNKNSQSSLLTSEMILSSLANPDENPNSESDHPYTITSSNHDRVVRIEPGKIRASNNVSK